ncbi:MAG: hypothetical protein AB7N80_08515 [Bdellovibrionales bacterium]
MDPFEEFEIKPLSEGLGFHKKSVPLSEQVKKSGLAEAYSVQIPSLTQADKEKLQSNTSSKPQAFADLLKALESPASARAPAPMRPMVPAPVAASELMITEPLPAPGTAKKKAVEVEIPRPQGPEFPTLNPARPSNTTPLSKVVENVGLKRGAADSPMRMLERASVSIPSAVLDGVVVFALSLMFLVTLMTITKVDLAALVFQVGMDVPTKVAFGVLFASVLLMYIVVVRSFYGRTLGEWTFDHQMGDDQQQMQALYPVQVMWRAVLIMATGVITIPLLSMIFGRDLLAPLTGLQLYRSR